MRRILIWVALLFSSLAGATTMLRQDLPALVRGSVAVVRGTVKHVQSRWSGDHRRILTEVELEVVETFKGAVGARVIVQQPGGQVGDIGQSVSGLATFIEGEEVVVFLERRGDSRFGVVGLAQGKYRLQRSSDGTRTFAVPESVGDALLLDPVTQQPVEAAVKPVELGELRAAIRSAAGQP